jgi:hypothetical protein
MDKPLDLKKAKELCEKATPGPWECSRYIPLVGWQEQEVTLWELDGPPMTCEYYGSRFENEGDAEFVAESRTLLPQAISEIEKLRVALNLAGRVLDDALTWGFVDEDMVDAAHKCIKDAQILTGQKGLND